MFSILLLTMFWCQDPDATIPDPEQKSKAIHRASQNGPVMSGHVFNEKKSGYALFLDCKKAVEKNWLPQVYQNAKAVDIDVDLDMNVKPPRGLNYSENIEVRVNLEGMALPNGQYRFNVQGELGEMDLFRGPTKKMLIYHTGKGFSDQNLPRGKNANIQSFRSYALRYLGQLQSQVLTKSGYRFIYAGSGNYQGQLIDRIKIAKAKPRRKPKTQKKRKKTVPLNRLWTFWQSGEYELWVYQNTHLPATLFYANPEDHIYANMTFEYHSDLLPSSILLKNNSSSFKGRAKIQLEYDSDRTLNRVAFKMQTSEAHDMSFEAQLSFKSEFDPANLRGIPPFDYQKMNADHLKILMLTPIIGNLLNLQQQGLKLKNFKY